MGHWSHGSCSLFIFQVGGTSSSGREANSRRLWCGQWPAAWWVPFWNSWYEPSRGLVLGNFPRKDLGSDSNASISYVPCGSANIHWSVFVDHSHVNLNVFKIMTWCFVEKISQGSKQNISKLFPRAAEKAQISKHCSPKKGHKIWFRHETHRQLCWGSVLQGIRSKLEAVIAHKMLLRGEALRKVWRDLNKSVSILVCTPPKTNMEPENGPLEKEIPFGNHPFQVPC